MPFSPRRGLTTDTPPPACRCIFVRHTLKLVNAIGSPLEERTLPESMAPRYIAMDGSYVIVAGVAAAYVWHYKIQASTVFS